MATPTLPTLELLSSILPLCTSSSPEGSWLIPMLLNHDQGCAVLAGAARQACADVARTSAHRRREGGRTQGALDPVHLHCSAILRKLAPQQVA